MPRSAGSLFVAVPLLATMIAACAPWAGGLPRSGTVLSETSRKIGHGYTEVRREEVNPPGAFEGVGHFSYVEYRGVRLCRCTANEIAISPGGEHAIYVSPQTGRLILFSARTRSRRELTHDFVGYPRTVNWDTARSVAVVTVQKPSQSDSGSEKLTINLGASSP